MKYASIVAAVFAAWPAAAQQAPADIKLLTPAECATISRRSNDEFYVTGPVKIGVVSISTTNITRNFASINGVNAFDVIERSCFNGRPS